MFKKCLLCQKKRDTQYLGNILFHFVLFSLYFLSCGTMNQRATVTWFGNRLPLVHSVWKNEQISMQNSQKHSLNQQRFNPAPPRGKNSNQYKQLHEQKQIKQHSPKAQKLGQTEVQISDNIKAESQAKTLRKLSVTVRLCLSLTYSSNLELT